MRESGTAGLGLREAASRQGNKSIQLKVLLADADADFPKQDRSAIAEFPINKVELYQYDVIIFGDVDPRSPALSDQIRSEPATRCGRGVPCTRDAQTNGMPSAMTTRHLPCGSNCQKNASRSTSNRTRSGTSRIASHVRISSSREISRTSRRGVSNVKKRVAFARPRQSGSASYSHPAFVPVRRESSISVAGGVAGIHRTSPSDSRDTTRASSLIRSGMVTGPGRVKPAARVRAGMEVAVWRPLELMGQGAIPMLLITLGIQLSAARPSVLSPTLGAVAAPQDVVVGELDPGLAESFARFGPGILEEIRAGFTLSDRIPRSNGGEP